MSGNSVFSETRIKALHSRAQRLRTPDSPFLTLHAGAEIVSRLAVTNRRFERVLVLDAFPEEMRAALAESAGNTGVECRDLLQYGDNLELEPGGHDLIIAGPALHRRNDIPGTLIQINRALVPDGLFMGVLPGDGSLDELRQSLIAAESRHTGGAAMRTDPFIEIRQAGGLLQRAGFALPVADVETLDLRYGDLLGLIRDLRANGASNASAEKIRPLRRDVFESAREHYRQNHLDADGRLKVTVNLVYLTGWTAHESQQKPLKPGSASHSLADFIGNRKTG